MESLTFGLLLCFFIPLVVVAHWMDGHDDLVGTCKFLAGSDLRSFKRRFRSDAFL